MRTLVLRILEPGDAAALRRVAERDSAPVPAGRVLGVEVDGELRAAICLDSGAVVADPFQPTADLVDLLRRRAAAQVAAAPRAWREREPARAPRRSSSRAERARLGSSAASAREPYVETATIATSSSFASAPKRS